MSPQSQTEMNRQSTSSSHPSPRACATTTTVKLRGRPTSPPLLAPPIAETRPKSLISTSVRAQTTTATPSGGQNSRAICPRRTRLGVHGRRPRLSTSRARMPSPSPCPQSLPCPARNSSPKWPRSTSWRCARHPVLKVELLGGTVRLLRVCP